MLKGIQKHTGLFAIALKGVGTIAIETNGTCIKKNVMPNKKRQRMNGNYKIGERKLFVNFFLPLKPISWNKFYAGMHWTKRSQMIHEWRWAVITALQEKGVKKVEPLDPTFHIRFTAYKKTQVLDVDNVCVKPIIDGLKDYGLIKDDTPRYIESIELWSKIGLPEGVEVDIFTLLN